jgi:hypothetical protein
MVAIVPVFRALLPTLSRNSAVQVHSQIWEIVVPQHLRAATIRKQDASPQGRAGGLPSQTECNIPDEPQIVGINNPLVPKTNTQETENLDKAIFF